MSLKSSLSLSSAIDGGGIDADAEDDDEDDADDDDDDDRSVDNAYVWHCTRAWTPVVRAYRGVPLYGSVNAERLFIGDGSSASSVDGVA
jgi:hypothetical protein